MVLSTIIAWRASVIAFLSSGLSLGWKRPVPSMAWQARMMRLRWRSASFDPATSAATLFSSFTFHSMKASMSGWSMSTMTILAARRVVPPDLMAPAARSPMRRKLIRPEDLPPPASGSSAARRREKLVPVPEPYLNSRASRTHRSMIPPSFTRFIVDALDEAGVRLRVLVGVGRLVCLAGAVIDEIVALGRAVDPIGPVKAGVEPLRRVGRGDLAREHCAALVEEGERVGLRIEIAALPAPVGPGAGQAVEHVLGRALAAGARGLIEHRQRVLVRDVAPQPFEDFRLGHRLEARPVRRPCGNTSGR